MTLVLVLVGIALIAGLTVRRVGTETYALLFVLAALSSLLYLYSYFRL